MGKLFEMEGDNDVERRKILTDRLTFLSTMIIETRNAAMCVCWTDMAKAKARKTTVTYPEPLTKDDP